MLNNRFTLLFAFCAGLFATQLTAAEATPEAAEAPAASNDPTKAAQAKKLRAEAETAEIGNLKTKANIADNVHRKSQQQLTRKRRDAERSRRQAAQDIGKAQKKHQDLLDARQKFEEKAKKREKELEDRRKAAEKRREAAEAKKAREEERKTTVTQILSDLFDARKIQTEASELTDPDKLQEKFKAVEEKKAAAEKIHAQWIAKHTKPLQQAQEALKDITAIVTKVQEMTQKATVDESSDEPADEASEATEES